jgi:S1-C subfamily serine protease
MTLGAALVLLAGAATASAITWNPTMTDPVPNTNRNVSVVSFNLAAQSRFNGTGIVSVTANAGSGNLISDQWVLTARHVVAGATNGTIFLEGTNRAI